MLETTEFGARGRKPSYARGLSPESRKLVHDEIYNASKHFLTRYRGSRKTFVLQNWEADNAMKYILRDMKLNEAERAVAYQGLTDYINTRQEAVEAARRDCGTNGVQVLHAFEVNWVPPGTNLVGGRKYQKNQPLVVDEVVPRTRCDLYSLSSWETWEPGKDAGVFDRLQYLKEKAPDNALFGSDNIMLGEFGVHEEAFQDPKKNHPAYVGDTSGAQFYAVHLMTIAALRAGARYILYWELYANDAIGIKKHEGQRFPEGVRATTEQCIGNWLIRPDGSRVATYDYFKALLDTGKEKRP